MSPAWSARRRRPVRGGTSTVRRIGVVLIVLWSVIPIYWALKMSFQTEGDARAIPAQFFPIRPTLQNYARLLGSGSDVSGGIRQSTINIVIECALATIITILLATIAAYAFSRLHFKGKNIFFYAVLATMAFPPYTTLIPLYRIMSGFGLVNTYTGIVLVYVSGFLPLATWIMHNYFQSLPDGIEEAGLVDGARRLQVLWHLLLPLARPGIISTALITFLFAWGQFLFPLVLSSDLSTQPLTVVIAALQGRHDVPSTLMSAAGVLAIIIPALIALIFNRYIVNGLLTGSTR
ncbi:ABC transporter permease [Microlunatus endophyticus]|uniref:ABC transporter permease n=1 Tax=Microlunatus endophyticus TaxID=1716077 RepID=A0A917RZA0_9ACTN|nr:carbohydrate ABC transporter permease [Microlunatus endophyticus]GGL46342.1 ABC transporter permease [Microlunatus endophyticus]